MEEPGHLRSIVSVITLDRSSRSQMFFKTSEVILKILQHLQDNKTHFLQSLFDKVTLTLLRMDFFGAAQGWGEGGCKKAPPPVSKICHTYPTLMKLGTVILLYFTYRRSKKYINHVTHPLSSAGTSIFSQFFVY